MKAALALIFLACVTGSMANQKPMELVQGLVQQGQAVATAVLGQLQQQILNIVQQGFGQLTSLVGSIGGRAGIFDDLINNFKPMLETLAQQALAQVLGSLSGVFGSGRGAFDGLTATLAEFLAQIQGTVVSMGQHVLNQGLGAVLGGLGSLGGSRAIGDIFAGISAQISTAVTAAQGALTGVWGGLQTLGGNLLDASKPHWEQLQENLVGHGLNVLGSLSETVNNLHGSITGGR